ncbi:MAG: hypothetical protein ACR2LR_22200 [Hassallia sp.]
MNADNQLVKLVRHGAIAPKANKVAYGKDCYFRHDLGQLKYRMAYKSTLY